MQSPIASPVTGHQPPAAFEKGYSDASDVALGQTRRVLTTAQVVALCFFSVCGGAMGSEGVFGAGGPALGLIALAIFPFAWCIPISLILAELCTMYPENGGYTLWVFHAFGPFWGFQEGFWAWLSGAIDNALYPSLAVTCLSKYIPELADNTVGTWFLKGAFALVFALPNMFGVQLVGRGMVVLTAVVTLPFLIFSIWGFATADDWGALGQFRYADTELSNSTADYISTGGLAVQWDVLMGTIFWSFNGFASVSTFAGEVANPSKTYPTALAITIVFVELTYLIPLVAGTVFNEPLWHTWTEISFSDLGFAVGGNALLALITVATMASTWGMYSSEMFWVSFQLTGMAEAGLAPTVFSRRSKKSDVPYVSVALSGAIIVVLMGLDFSEVLLMANVLSSMSQILLIASAIKLRVTQPDVLRPYRVPGGMTLLVAISILPVAVCGYLVYSTFALESTITPVVLVPTVVVVGFVYAWLMKLTPKQFIAPKPAGPLFELE
ncbi:hypothetical protein H257_01681 [Aphanomyces astaci]|uniref:Amino acid permease/ SLC12A domain-containing protein n=2 Tax=Aphanomyces astaci TaxID=112090 RepID=W4H4G9_APHAT|nr:hypothetical protein H257_01681 [Aphanomyces astaci]ETV86501.1 hypothetical protein H257_01681 [Aphanomyces astaci]|eukprot:XP_009823300.1 hypothetical protein H257_01681 [Aphanomyces astaci]